MTGTTSRGIEEKIRAKTKGTPRTAKEITGTNPRTSRN